jgi:hypothetical protein
LDLKTILADIHESPKFEPEIEEANEAQGGKVKKTDVAADPVEVS